jgi:hypothetical protein
MTYSESRIDFPHALEPPTILVGENDIICAIDHEDYPLLSFDSHRARMLISKNFYLTTLGTEKRLL